MTAEEADLSATYRIQYGVRFLYYVSGIIDLTKSRFVGVKCNDDRYFEKQI